VTARRDLILILDFGGQYTQLIARRVREQKVYSEIHPFNVPLAKIRELGPRGIILSGGPASCYAADAPKISSEIYDLGVPILGICYGTQLTALTFGGKVIPAERREYGRATVRVQGGSDLFHGFAAGEEIPVWMSHGDRVEALPAGFDIVGESANCPAAAVAAPARRFWGVQFHPEVAHTPRGGEILANFLFRICGCEPSWTMAGFVGEAVAAITAKVGSHGRAVCGLSGGVDSSVAAALVLKAMGSRLTSIFVDTGLQRANEAAQVESLFRDAFKADLRVVDASERFLGKLAGVTDPEQKRKIIGREFIAVFEEEAKKVGDAEFLVQGTLYPDVIESAARRRSQRSFVTSPRMRTASPGPGNGCRHSTWRGSPSSAPSSRTSSLNSSRSGSTSLRFIFSGRPPTLWCDLIVAEGPLCDTDSITSG